TGARISQINVGQGPTGLAINADGSRLYVLNKFDGSVSTIDTNVDTELSRISFFDPTPSSIKLGRPFLYNTHTTSGLGQASCASCHIDGRTDHLGWDLGDPQGSIIIFNQQCQAPGPNPPCTNWHPMKGTMVTQTLQVLPGGLRCVDCHALPAGTNNRIDIPAPGEPQNRKNAQLRNMLEKTGFDRTSQQSNRGFGFDHDGDEDSIFTLLSVPGFQF